ncbi:MAG: hypothetical protein ACYCYP_07660 [Leptospirales bacterium]
MKQKSLPDRWTISPTVGYFIPTGSGNSAYFNSALSVGAELSYRPGRHPGRFRWVASFSYLQMTPGPTLASPISSGNLFSSSSGSSSITGPIPGSANITGFLFKGGAAWSFGNLFPERWTAWGTLDPYLRGDIGMASLSASGTTPFDGHPYGLLLDMGGGMEWHVPGYPMGVFVEMDPTGLNMNGAFLFLTPLVSGISIWF